MGMGPAGGGRAELRWWRRRIVQEAAFLLPVLAATLWYFRPLLLSADVLYGGLDITRHFFFFKQASIAEIQAGRLPLWTPLVYGGMPLLGAVDDTPFHPWDGLAALLNLPLPVIFNVGLLLHLMIGQIGAYVWVRQDSKWRLPAALAACWIWNPFVLNSIVIGDHLNIRALLLAPAIFAALERALDRPRFRRAWLIYGLLQALQILTSALQIVFYTCALGGLTILGTLIRRRGHEPPAVHSARVRWWLLATGLALMLPLVQLLPGLEFGNLSVRGGAQATWAHVWGIAPGQLLSYVAPFVDPRETILLYWGIIPLWFAFVGILAWPHPRKRWYVVMLVGSLILCVGEAWPLSAWLNSLPILHRFRGPFRMALFANLMLARLAAGGVEVTYTLLSEGQHQERWARAARHAGVALGALAVAALVWWPLSEFFSSWEDALPTLLQWAVAAGLLAALYTLRRPWILVVLGLATVADWSTHLHDYWQPHETRAFQPDAQVAQLRREDGEFRVWLRATPAGNYMSLFGIPTVAGHHPFPLRRAAHMVQALRHEDNRLLRLMQTRYVFTYRRPRGGQLGPPIQSAHEVEVRVVRGDPIPKYRVVGAGRWLDTDSAVWDVMRSAEWDPVASPVLLEGPVPASARAVGSGGVARVVREESAEREIHVDADGPGYLVIAETWYPGWEATVDGRPTALLRANYQFQAVPVPAGVSTVHLRFRPFLVRIGLFSSALGLAAFAMAYAIAARRDFHYGL